MPQITLRDLELKDLDDYLYWKNQKHKHNKFNGPYYPRESEAELVKTIKLLEFRLKSGEKKVLKDRRIIADGLTDKIIGEVNRYWKSEETFWMEIGLVVFDDRLWGHGIGKNALKMWIDENFEEFPSMVRIGLSTWSGNKRMLQLAEKMGMYKEAVYRKARIVNNEYFDSVSYGILREEWAEFKNRLIGSQEKGIGEQPPLMILSSRSSG